jgi:threonine/homoserine/homoserine lactone efflux protein
MTDLLKVLPLAVVMIAGPQMITAIMLTTSTKPRENSYAFVGGAVLATAAATTIFYYVAKVLKLKISSHGSSSSLTVDWVLVVVLVLAALWAFRGRNTSEPPKWMSTLQSEAPRGSFRLGLVLFLVMPTDVMMTFTVGTYLAAHGSPLWHASGFVLLTAFLIGSPLLVLLMLGRHADTLLPRMRDWMNANSWLVSEAVIVFFLVMEIKTIVTS